MTEHILRVTLDLNEMFEGYKAANPKLKDMKVTDARVQKSAVDGSIKISVDFSKQLEA